MVSGPFCEGKPLAFALEHWTCPAVDEAFDTFQKELQEALGTPDYDMALLDSIVGRLRQRVKDRGTHPLRRALVWACAQIADKTRPTEFQEKNGKQDEH